MSVQMSNAYDPSNQCRKNGKYCVLVIYRLNVKWNKTQDYKTKVSRNIKIKKRQVNWV